MKKIKISSCFRNGCFMLLPVVCIEKKKLSWFGWGYWHWEIRKNENK